jgi:CheY-like chemotaxis protein
MKNPLSLASRVTIPLNSLIPHILVVDDDPGLRNLLVRFYSEIGYTALSVASGEETLAQLEQGNIDLSLPTFNSRA